MQIRSAALARMGAIVFAYDMVGYGESQQITHRMPIALLLQTYNSRRVLDVEHSLPSDALMGDEVVMSYLGIL